MKVLTQDTFAGAWLLCQGARLVEVLVDRSAGRSSGTFVFEGDQNILAHHEVYCRGQAVAPVKEIREGVSFLRTRLAQALRTPQPERAGRRVANR